MFLEGKPFKLLDGRNVADLRLGELRNECVRLRVPGIDGKSNKNDITGALYAYLTTVAASQRGPNEKFSYPLSQEALQRALETAEEKAAAAAWNSR